MQTEFHSIGPEHPVYLIAEIGLNHNGSEDLALKMVESAAASGASCAKFQLFDSTHFINGAARLGDSEPGSLQSFFRQFELPGESWKRIVSACKSNGIDFLCSVFDEPSLDLYESLGKYPVKIASTDLTCKPLLDSVIRRRFPIYLSTGASEESEVEQTIQWTGKPALLFQCVSSYPASESDYNLNVLSHWQKKYKCFTGISDHCTDNLLSMQMPALGGVAIERHFTLDRNMEGPDHSLSSTPEEFATLRRSLDRLQKAMGDGVKQCMPSELGVRNGGRRSLYYVRNLGIDHVLSEADIRAMRPGGGIAAQELQNLPGRKLLRPVHAGEMVRLEDVH